jgi:hypothetical protein
MRFWQFIDKLIVLIWKSNVLILVKFEMNLELHYWRKPNAKW